VGCRASSTEPLGRCNPPRAHVHQSRGGAVIFVGVDWAEDHHDICVMNQDGAVVGVP